MKRFAVLFFGVALFAWLTPTLVFGDDAGHAKPAAAHGASDAEHGTASAGHDAAHGAESHGPSYGLLTVDGMAMVWTIVVFLLLLVILRAVAWKPIQQALVQRERFIEDSLAQAKKERHDAERLLRQYTEQVEKARVEATAIVEEGKRDAEAVRKRLHEEAQAEAHAMVERAKRELSIAKDDAVKALYQQSVELASQMAGKLVRKQLTPDDQRALLDEALAEIGNARR